MKYFVFGANGFIGSNLKKYLPDKTKFFDNGFLNKDLSSGIEKLCLVNDKDIIKEIFEEEKSEFCVINLAAIHYIPYCEDNPAETYFSNVLGNQMLAESVINTNCSKFIFASSGAVYRPSTAVHLETDVLCSSDVYSASKISAENDLKSTLSDHNIQVSILRLFNVVGAHDYTPHIIPEFFDQIKSKTKYLSHGNLSTIRDYVHVEDVCEVILLLSKMTYGKNFETFNICSGRGIQGDTVLSELQNITGCKKDSKIDKSKLRKSDRPSQVGSYDKLYKLSGWLPLRTFEEGLNDYVSFRENS